MNTPDLDALRGRWAAANRTIDANLHLDADAMRQALISRSRRAFRRHGYGLVAGMVAMGSITTALALFVVSHRADALYLLCALPLLALSLAELVVDLRQARTLARLDLGAPTLTVRSTLQALRTRRLAVTKWIFLTSVLLWWPAIAVLLKGLFGADLLRGLPPSFWWVNLVVGVVFFPLAGGLGHAIARRFGARRGFQRFLDEVAGRSWNRATQAYEAQTDFEQVLDAGDEIALQQRLARPAARPPMLGPLLRALRWRLIAGIALSVTAMLAVGAFNAQHGGQWRFIVPGIVLNLFCVAQLVPGILHSVFLSRLDYRRDAASLRAECEDMAALRRRVAHVSLSLAPVIALLLAQVLAKAIAGIDLIGTLGPWGSALALATALGASAWLLRTRRPGWGRDARGIEVLVLGAAAATQRLGAAIAGEEPAREADPARQRREARGRQNG